MLHRFTQAVRYKCDSLYWKSFSVAFLSLFLSFIPLHVYTSKSYIKPVKVVQKFGTAKTSFDIFWAWCVCLCIDLKVTCLRVDRHHVCAGLAGLDARTYMDGGAKPAVVDNVNTDVCGEPTTCSPSMQPGTPRRGREGRRGACTNIDPSRRHHLRSHVVDVRRVTLPAPPNTWSVWVSEQRK